MTSTNRESEIVERSNAPDYLICLAFWMRINTKLEEERQKRGLGLMSDGSEQLEVLEEAGKSLLNQ